MRLSTGRFLAVRTKVFYFLNKHKNRSIGNNEKQSVSSSAIIISEQRSFSDAVEVTTSQSGANRIGLGGRGEKKKNPNQRSRVQVRDERREAVGRRRRTLTRNIKP